MSQTPQHQHKSKKLRIKALKTFKTYCLIATFSTSFIALSISLFISNYKDRPQFQFPNQLALTEWRSQSNNNLNNILETSLKEGVVDSRRYLYTTSRGEALRIDAFYVKKFVTIPDSLVILGLKISHKNLNIRYTESIGYYALFFDQERAYLSACINPRGGTTVTREQFMNNRNSYDITSDRIVSYLFGITDLRDIRCLFTVMSVPLENKQIGSFNNNLLDTSYQKLEKAWGDWYKKWENNFPKD